MIQYSLRDNEASGAPDTSSDKCSTRIASRGLDTALLLTPSDSAELVQPEGVATNATNKQADRNPLQVSLKALEDLPAELRRRLLSSMPDLQTLASLIHSSPIYHAQYRLERKPILSQAILTELGEDVFVDVYAAFKSRRSQIGPRKGPNTNVTDFLVSYRQWRSTASSKTLPGLCSLDDLQSIAWFYTAVVSPLTSQFVAWALANLDSVPARSNDQSA